MNSLTEAIVQFQIELNIFKIVITHLKHAVIHLYLDIVIIVINCSLFQLLASYKIAKILFTESTFQYYIMYCRLQKPGGNKCYLEWDSQCHFHFNNEKILTNIEKKNYFGLNFLNFSKDFFTSVEIFSTSVFVNIQC